MQKSLPENIGNQKSFGKLFKKIGLPHKKAQQQAYISIPKKSWYFLPGQQQRRFKTLIFWI